MRRRVAGGPVFHTSFLVSALLATSISLFAQTTDKVTASPTANQAPFQIKVTSNLVVVRVVVRDAQNKPVENLKKEDFNLFDRGKKQSIVQFAADPSSSPLANPAPPGVPGQPSVAAAATASMPQRFLALYFDDLNTSDANMILARDAADRYLAANLSPTDRVAIFTPSQRLTDFTVDPKQIHDALFKLHASPLALTLEKNQDCPELSDYQAQQIIDYDDENIDAWQIALDEAKNNPKCLRVPVGQPGEPQRYIATLARRVVDEFGVQVRANLQALGEVVKYTARMPGQRTVLLVSPGFLSRSEQSQLEAVIDHALRAQVVISSLDPKGLTNITREGDTSHEYLPMGQGAGLTQGMDRQREAAATDLLAEVAQGTGGQFIHNTNDLQAGFGALAASPGYYLAFAPTDMKLDGKFHDLKVALAEKHNGFSVQARRGYFAPGKEFEVPTEAAQKGAADPDAQAKEQVREAVLSKTDLKQLPVTIDAKVFSTKTEARELAMSAHLDTKSLHFRKEGDRNVNTVTFVVAIFDQKDTLLQLQRGQSKLDAPDSQLQQVTRAGLQLDSTFQLKPGIYRVREVVTDSEEHHITAISRNVDVSTECCASRDVAANLPASAPPSSQPRVSPRPADVQPTRANTSTYLDYSLRKLTAIVPELVGIKAESSQDQLPSILAKAGEATAHSLSSVPNLSSREDVYSTALSRSGGPANSVLGMEETPLPLDLVAQLRETRSVEFNYLLLFDHHPDGGTAIKELRTDFKNRQVDSSMNGVALHGYGFAYQWLLLSPANQSELRFRYLGQQRIDDHATFVLSFAQIPNQVKEPGEFRWAGKEASFFFQGIVWIDQSTYDVVRLRTDLLSPIPSVDLRQMTTSLRFRSVRIHGFPANFWLPTEVIISTGQSETTMVELHEYSAYKFYHAESRLLP